jgi:hypothetical protein
VLESFSRISGFKTNIEKTLLMPIGQLNELLNSRRGEFGFSIVKEMKTLGIVINNTAQSYGAILTNLVQGLLKL